MIEMDIQVGDYTAKPRLITLLGVPATVGVDHGDATGAWQLVMTVTREPGDQLQIVTEPSIGRPLKAYGKHTQFTAAGLPFPMSFGSPSGGPSFKMTRIVSLLPAGAAVPPAPPALSVKPPPSPPSPPSTPAAPAAR